MAHPILRYVVHNQFLTALLIASFAWLLLEIKEILVILFASYIITVSLLPPIEFLRRKGIPRMLAVVVSYFTTLILLVLIIIPLIPFFIAQIQSLFGSLPFYLGEVARILGVSMDPGEVRGLIASEFETIGKNAFVVTSRIFGGLFSAVTILVVSFYLLMDYARIKAGVVKLFPADWQARGEILLTHIEEKLGAWFRGQIMLSGFIAAVTWLTLTLLGLDFALPLALIAGILEIVPTIGPILSAVPAVIVALTVSPANALFVVLAYVGIQMLENNVLVPKIMQKAVGLNPVIIIAGVMAGSKLMGVVGALLSIPFISMLLIIFHRFRSSE